MVKINVDFNGLIFVKQIHKETIILRIKIGAKPFTKMHP